MTKKISKKVGRPTDLVPETVTKLESILKIGGTIEEATTYAGIARETYYRWLKSNDSFVTKMERAKHYADVAAKNVVVKAITEDEDLSTAKWWLEKREFRDSPSVAVQVNVENKLSDEQLTRIIEE